MGFLVELVIRLEVLLIGVQRFLYVVLYQFFQLVLYGAFRCIIFSDKVCSLLLVNWRGNFILPIGCALVLLFI